MRLLPCWCVTLVLLYLLRRFLPFPLPLAGQPSSLARIFPCLSCVLVCGSAFCFAYSFSWSSLLCVATAFHLYLFLLCAPSWSCETWTWVWAVARVAVMTTRATTTMQPLTVLTMLRRWRYPFGLPSVVCVCLLRCRSFPIRPYHVTALAIYKACVWTGWWDGSACSQTSTLSLPYLSLPFVIPCVARTCACVGTGHRAYLLLFLCSSSWCACFAAAACTHTMLRSAVLAAFCSSCVLGLVVCLLWSHISFRVDGLKRGRGGWFSWRLRGRWARWRGGPLVSPLAAALVVYFLSPFLVLPSTWRLRRRVGTLTLAPSPYLALFVLACVGIPPPLAPLVPLGLWYVCFVAVVCSAVACGSLLTFSCGCPSYHNFFPCGLVINYSLIPPMLRSAVLTASCSSCVLRIVVRICFGLLWCAVSMFPSALTAYREGEESGSRGGYLVGGRVGVAVRLCLL